MKAKLICLFFITSCLGFIGGAQKEAWKETQRWVVTKNSNLRVLGSTNLNKFRCDIIGYSNSDTICIKSINQIILFSGMVSLDVANFNCHNAIMTKELRKTLEANTYPELQIQFISLNSLPELNAKVACISGLVDIKIAGKCKRYNVDYELSKDAADVIHLNGRREIKFSDFDLKPPKKIGGMITAKDKLIVEFNLNLKSI